MKTIEEVKGDLVTIRKKKADIESFNRTKAFLTSQIAIFKQSGKATDELERYLRETEMEITKAIERTAKRDATYIMAISNMPRLYRIILFEHYIDGQVMWKVADKIGYSERSAKAFLRQALEELTKILNNESGS